MTTDSTEHDYARVLPVVTFAAWNSGVLRHQIRRARPVVAILTGRFSGGVPLAAFRVHNGPMEPKRFNWQYPPEMKAELEKAAKEDGRSINAELTYLLGIALEIRDHHRKTSTLPLDWMAKGKRK